MSINFHFIYYKITFDSFVSTSLLLHTTPFIRTFIFYSMGVSFPVYFCVLMGNSRLARLFPVFQYLLISSIFAEYTNWFICFEQLRQNRRIPIDQSNEDDRTCDVHPWRILIRIYPFLLLFFSLFSFKNVSEQRQAVFSKESHWLYWTFKIYDHQLITLQYKRIKLNFLIVTKNIFLNISYINVKIINLYICFNFMNEWIMKYPYSKCIAFSIIL